MAVAVKTDAPASRNVQPLGLAGASIFATLYVVVGFLVVEHLLPYLFERFVVGEGIQPSLTAQMGLLGLMLAAVVGWVWAWPKIFRPMPGLKAGAAAGTAWVVGTLIVIYLAWRIVQGLAPTFVSAEWLQQNPNDAALYVGGVTAAIVSIGCLVFGYRLVSKPKTEANLVALEEQGWFSVGTYKRGQGLRTRRGTLIGLLVLIGAGIWVYGFRRMSFGGAPWAVSVPFNAALTIPLVRSAGVTMPILIGLILAWGAYRVVNYPQFADFLIATDAEMNKVSWTSRARLFQDTIVVLVTVILMSVFLLLVDLLWSFTLTKLGVIQQ